MPDFKQGQCVLEARGLSKSFPGVRALEEVSLEVRAGTVHAVMGENGAGKSRPRNRPWPKERRPPKPSNKL